MSSQPRPRTRRRTTVYDLASLQLHADGTRASSSSSTNNTSSTPSAVPSNIYPPRRTRSQTAALDKKGNSIAHDAAGPLRVKKDVFTRVSVKREDEEDDWEEFDFDRDDCGEIGQKRKRSTPLPSTPTRTLRPRKKRKANPFQEAAEESFLSGPSTPMALSMPTYAGSTPDVVPGSHPSGELLKIIHRFAAQYYTERGHLTNATQEYRREKKARQLERQKGKGKASLPEGLERMDVEPEEDEMDPAGDKNGGEEDDGQEPRQDDDGDQDGEHEKTPRKTRPRGGEQVRDMYKSMDGSALFALGMLVQAHVTSLTHTLVKQRIFSTDELSDIPQTTITTTTGTQPVHRATQPIRSAAAQPVRSGEIQPVRSGATQPHPPPGGLYTFETDPEDDDAGVEDDALDGDEDSDGLAEDETGDV